MQLCDTDIWAGRQTDFKEPFFCLSCDSSAQLCCHTRGTHGPSRARCSSGKKKEALRVSGPDTMEGRDVVRKEGQWEEHC